MVDFQQVFSQFQQWGVYDYVLPFFLVFSIIFAVLEKTRIFGVEDEVSKKPRKNINVIVSLVIGLLVVAQQPVVQAINLFLPKMSLYLIIIIMFLVATGIFGTKTGGFTGIPLIIAVILSIIAVIWSLSPGFGWSLPSWFQASDQDIALYILIAMILATIYYLGREPPPEQNKLWREIAKGLTGGST